MFPGSAETGGISAEKSEVHRHTNDEATGITYFDFAV